MNNDKAVKSAPKKAEHLDSAPSNPITVVAQGEAKSIQDRSADQDKSLSTDEQELLAECETDIIKNQQGFFMVGYRLWQIRDQELYRATHKQFAKYCNEKFDFSKTHANRLIQAYLCEQHLNGIKDVEVYVPTKESQVRWISDLEPEQQIEVAHEVLAKVGDGVASAGDFGEARGKLFPKPKREVKASKLTKPAAVQVPPTPSNVVPLKFDTNLVSLAEIHKLIVQAYDDFSSGQEGKLREGLRKLKAESKKLADWQAQQPKQQEAA